jgi:hypothetical protein
MKSVFQVDVMRKNCYVNAAHAITRSSGGQDLGLVIASNDSTIRVQVGATSVRFTSKWPKRQLLLRAPSVKSPEVHCKTPLVLSLAPFSPARTRQICWSCSSTYRFATGRFPSGRQSPSRPLINTLSRAQAACVRQFVVRVIGGSDEETDS